MVQIDISREQRSRANLIGQQVQTTPSPIVGVAVGTAGCWRLSKWAQLMGESGTLGRFQSLVFYDDNSTTLDRLKSEMRRLKRGSTRVILPDTIENAEGYLQNPENWLKDEGPIKKQLQDLVDLVKNRAQDLLPSTIVLFLGFGGHAKPGLLMYEYLKEAFPNAVFLPIILLPKDQNLYSWMRRKTWRMYEEALGKERVLVTDNIVGKYEDIDYMLALGLTCIEAGRTNGFKGGSLAETIEGFNAFQRNPRDGDHRGKTENGDHPAGGQDATGAADVDSPRGEEVAAEEERRFDRWFGMSVVQERLPAERRWNWVPPFRRLKLVRGASSGITRIVRRAILDCVHKGEGRLHKNDHPDSNVMRRMAVTTPMGPQDLDRLSRDVQNVMDYDSEFELYKEQHPISWGSANIPENTAETDNQSASTKGFVGKLWERRLKIFGALAAAGLTLLGFWIAWTLFNQGLTPFTDPTNASVHYFIGVMAAVVVALIYWAVASKYYHLVMHGKYADQKYLHVNICCFYPMQGPITRVLEILRGASETQEQKSAEDTGFGTYVHLIPQQVMPEDEESTGQEEPAGATSRGGSTNGGSPFSTGGHANKFP